jgi:uncharacterized protein (TIGR02246 family)
MTLTHRPLTFLTVCSIAAFASLGLSACGNRAPAADSAAASEVATAWAKAFNTGDASAVAALYAEDAHSMPPGGPAISGRSEIEAYWRDDLGSGGVMTTLTPADSIRLGDLLHVDGTYAVAANDGITVAKGQYQQLWGGGDGQWRVLHEIWRLDPSLQRDTDAADRLSSSWMKAYNAGDATALTALYAPDAELSTQPSGSVHGREAIGSFWSDDFGSDKPSTTLTLTDVYLAGDLAHLEGAYEVVEKGKSTKGRYVQLWMREGNTWQIHREMWWRQ